MSAGLADRVAAELWQSATDGVYAILDAARDPRIHRTLTKNPDGCACLYSTNPTGIMATVAPYLVGLEPKTRFTRELLADGWGNAWGFFVRSPLDLERTRRHFKRFLRAQTEDGKKVVFRYYDPRVLRVYLPTCTLDELLRFFGAATDLVMEGESPGQLLTFSRGSLGFSCTRLDLDATEPTGELDEPGLGSTTVLTRTAVDGTAPTPLVRAATRDAVHLAARSDVGPLLASARRTEPERPAASEPERGLLWTFPALTDDLLSSPRGGLAASAPELVERTPGWRWPLRVSQRGSADDLDRLVLEERGFLVFVEDGSGAARIAPLMTAGGAPRLPLRLLGEEPDPLRLEPAARVLHVDATHRLRFPAAPTKGTLFVVMADQRSEVSRVTVDAAPASAEELRVAGPEIAPRRVTAASGEAGAPQTPPVGLALALERYALRRQNTSLVLRGAFRLPAGTIRASVGGVEVTLVATGAACPVPRALAFVAEADRDGDHVIGDFAVDLFATELCDATDTWFVHAFVSGRAAGPAVTTVVPEAD